MKTIAFALALMISASASFASTTSVEDNNKKPKATIELKEKVKHQINRFMFFPSSNKASLYGTADVTFTLNADGTLHVAHLVSDNDSLLQFIEHQLAKVKLNGDFSKNEEVFRFRFIFRKEA